MSDEPKASSPTEHRLANIEDDLRQVRRAIRKLRHTVFGNGKEGLAEVVRVHERVVRGLEASIAKTNTGIEALSASIDELKDSWRREKAMDEGGIRMWKRMSATLAVIATLLSLLGAVGAWQMNDRVGAVIQQLRNIPELPQ